ncbi:stabilizer of axonemal microtubules 2 [Talpa occidentalis]|uniref:stabilizer of axonemal microtubules 2 n=1 Tax=Talpa occidentalis TaxID=50954 RepID=UPI00188F8FE3|nr:stabilizer of axonemal microtubules 2 [Talpa occidentalis]
MRRCLCRICTCGRHRCPRGPTKLYESSGADWPPTEYAEKYPAHGNVLPAQSLRPKQELPACRGTAQGIPALKSRQPRARPGELEAVPTYRDDYRAWGLQKRELYKPEQSYCAPVVRFGNPTTFQDAFVPQAAAPPQSLKPPSAAWGPSGPFHGDTSHRLDYVPYQLPPRLARPKEAYKPPSRPFKGLTTHRRDFQGLAGEVVKPCGPPRPRAAPAAPFEGSTEFRESFQAWEVPPREARRAPEYTPPAGTMQLASTSRLHYVPHPGVLTESCRPREARAPSPGPFEDATVYSLEYTPKEQAACPASYPCPPGYVFEDTDSRGHRHFRRAPAVGAP